MQSVNEELQSTNEELETSKEELQSVNEQLQEKNQDFAKLQMMFEQTQANCKIKDERIRDLVAQLKEPGLYDSFERKHKVSNSQELSSHKKSSLYYKTQQSPNEYATRPKGYISFLENKSPISKSRESKGDKQSLAVRLNTTNTPTNLLQKANYSFFNENKVKQARAPETRESDQEWRQKERRADREMKLPFNRACRSLECGPP